MTFKTVGNKHLVHIKTLGLDGWVFARTLREAWKVIFKLNGVSVK